MHMGLGHVVKIEKIDLKLSKLLCHSSKTLFDNIITAFFHIYIDIYYRILNLENGFVVRNCQSCEEFGIHDSISIIHSRLKLYNFVKISLITNLGWIFKSMSLWLCWRQ